MSNRSNPTNQLESADAAINAVAEATGGGDRRRRWSKADKARIVQESLKPGAVVSEGAQRHGLTRWQLYDWRRKARTGTGDRSGPARPKRNGSTSKPVEALPAFAPVVMATPAIPPQPPSEASLVEIAIGGASVRVRGVVDVEGLVAVLNAVRRAS